MESPGFNEKIIWDIIDCYFRDNPQSLVRHHIESYNDFFKEDIFRIFKEMNPVTIVSKFDERSKEYKLKCNLYFGGKSGRRVYFAKPTIYDGENPHYMFPNEARLRNMTYGITIHYDVDIEFIYYNEVGEKVVETSKIEKVFLGKFPIMVQSNLCILNGLSTNVRFNLGECRNDFGGYFIIDGKEKVIISQEKFADNMLYIKEN